LTCWDGTDPRRAATQAMPTGGHDPTRDDDLPGERTLYGS